MGVIAELQLPAHQFAFGRRLPARTEVERAASGGDDSTPVFSLSIPAEHVDGGIDSRLADAGGTQVERLARSDGHDIRLVELDPNGDPFFRLLDEHEGSIRRGTGTTETWTFEVHFPGHEDFAAFRAACDGTDLSVDVVCIYNPTNHDTGAWYGLTRRQRRTLELAVERGYYDIPRRCTTIELADELGISDQAVTERLRRGIVTFVRNALLFDGDE
ncbi:MAG: helix-turn-helix domain-containing protein [Haloplanus sp.]